MDKRPEPRSPRSRPPGERSGDALLWQSLGLDPDLAMGRLAGATVTVELFGDVPIPRLSPSLGELGLRTGEVSDFTLALADDYLHEGLWERNLSALESGQPWLLAMPVGRRVLAGPAFWPGRTACWECLAESIRNRAFAWDQDDDARPGPPRPPGAARLPCTVQAGLALAVTEMARAMAGGEPSSGEVTLLSFDVVDRIAETGVVRPLRGCPACATFTPRGALRSVVADDEAPSDRGREGGRGERDGDRQATA